MTDTISLTSNITQIGCLSSTSAACENLIVLPLDMYSRTSTPKPPSAEAIIRKPIDDCDLGEVAYRHFRINLYQPPSRCPRRGLHQHIDDITGCHLVLDNHHIRLDLNSYDLSRMNCPKRQRFVYMMRKTVRLWVASMRKFLTNECSEGNCRDYWCRCRIEKSLMNKTIDERFNNVI